MLWLLIDFYATAKRFDELRAIERRLAKEGRLTAQARAVLAHKRVNLRLYLLRLFLWFPNAVHWCLPSGHPRALPTWLVQLLGLAEGLVGTYTLAAGRGIGCPTLPSTAAST